MIVFGLVVGGAAGDARGDTGTVLIPAGSELGYAVVRAPLPAQGLGAIAVAAGDRAAGVARTDVAPVVGAAPAGMPPATWPRALDGQVGATPFGVSDGRRSCRCKTSLGDTSVERIAVVYAARRFDVGADPNTIKLLRLRARYGDGLVAYINGREVARRNVAAGGPIMALAERPHGPEWETFYIPVTAGLLVRGANLLAVEVRPSGASLGPELDLELSAGERARRVRGPMVQRIGATEATLVFDTDLPATGVVEYGPTAALGQRAVSAGGGLAVHHEVVLRGLAAGGPVHYRVIAGGDVTEPAMFHTAPAPGEPLRFAVYGDMRGGHRVHGEIVESIVRDAPALVLVTGDLVLRGTDEGDWQRFFGVAADLLARVPYYPVAGNHDLGRSGDEQRRVGEIFALPPGPAGRPSWGHWYSFEVAGVHFVMLDSNAYEHADQHQWLGQDLAMARRRGVRAIFAAVHDGPYSRGSHGGSQLARDIYAPILAKHGVTMLFSGHDHLYQRGKHGGLRYVVSGGGGAPLYSIKCGVKGRRRCKVSDGAEKVLKEHHYLMLEVDSKRVTVCAKRPDGTPLEACHSYPL